ncbi:MAG: thioredoxin-disulfide reductase [Dehalococcoidia bacterium]|nr:thioredoxin-disulfide reductase [Dehalococcoidia bacterium]
MTESAGKKHQLIIIGGGPAGLTAGIYAARGRIDTLLIEKAAVGGQIVYAEKVENYPGFPEGISGFELTELMHKQAKKWGLKTLATDVTGLALDGEDRVVKTSDGDFHCRAVIVASGSERSKLGVPGEEKLLGRGVSYCATCDGAFFKDEVVAVVGGGNAALNEALALTHYAGKVYVIHRRNELRATKVVQERLFADPKIQMIWDTVVEEVQGEDKVQKLRVRNVKTDAISLLEVGGVFVATGLLPATDFVKGILELDPQGQIVTNEVMETGVPGIFAAGDVRHNSAKQCITAAGDGATAALIAERYINERG